MPYISGEDRRASSAHRERILLAFATLFVIANAAALSLVQTGSLSVEVLAAPAVWLVVVLSAHLVLSRYKPGRDPYLLPLIGLLTGWGLLLQDRLAPPFLWRQLLWFAVGSVILVAVAILPRSLSWLRRYRYTWLTLGLLLLVATLLFGVNPSGFGATLWLRVPLIPDVFFQPSELLKLLLVVFLASYFDDWEHLLWLRQAGRRHRLSYLAPLLLMWGVSMILLVLQRDLGAAVLFFLVFLGMLYLATGSWKYVGGGVVMLLLSVALGYFLFPLVALRVEAWWNPWPEATDRAFQIVQSLYALAAGNILGEGVGQGSPGFIPVVHSDFVFAAVAEEWGVIGSLAVVICFAVLSFRAMKIAGRRRQAFHLYLAAGIGLLFSVQSFLIMAGVTKLLPLTGVTLPFMSYGGSSLLISMLMAGLLLYLSAPDEHIVQ